jgi:spore maturation protein CgeB
MKILFAGNFQFDWYEKICADAIENLGNEVIRFSWHQEFSQIPGKIEAYFGWNGPSTWQVNYKLVTAATDNAIDILLIWRGVSITENTLRLIRQHNPKCTLISYNNDDPFSPKYTSNNAPINHRQMWVRFKKAIPYYDCNFVYRPINILEMFQSGAKQVNVLMPYFIPELNRPIELSDSEIEEFQCDIVFAGHYEPDGREKYIQQLVETGLNVKLYGGKYWNRQVLGDLLDYFGEIREVYGDEYAKALSGAKMCLCFLSKLNRDTYTRRCFEIPAYGKLLISERTEDLTRIFKEDEEAVFFSSAEELAEKAIWLSKHPEEIERISQAGMKRVHADGHSVGDRIREFMILVEKTHIERLSQCNE